MPNPTIIHPQSSKLRHFMGITDVYIRLGKPEIYEVEPHVTEEYRPDAYTRLNGEPVMIEYQRSFISRSRMQDKVNLFAEAYTKKKHDAKTLWIVTDNDYHITPPKGFNIVQKSLDAIV